MADSAP